MGKTSTSVTMDEEKPVNVESVKEEEKAAPPRPPTPNRKDVTTASENVMRAFAPIRMIAYAFGRFPFKTIKKENGTCVFIFKKFSVPAIYFYITSVFFGCIFIMLCIGYITMFLAANVSTVTDRCSITWEDFNLQRTSVPSALTVGWLYLTLSGSVLLLFRGKEYLHYLNYWNRAIHVLNLDPSEGAMRAGIIDSIHCLVLMAFFAVFYISKLASSLQDGAASIANALVRLFIQDIGVSNTFSDVVAHNVDCKLRKGKYYSHLDYDSVSFTLLKSVGFIIQIYAFYGSLCMIMQFRFYCRLLRNTAYIWNERFQNALHGVGEDITDQTKRRLALKYVMKDHLIVVQMFKLTETAFSSVLQSFYTIQIINLCGELFFLSAIKGVSACDKLFDDLKGEQRIIIKACLKLSPALDLDSVLTSTSKKWFSDPCSPAQLKVLQEALVAIALFLQTVRITFSITMEASLAYEEAMRGFQILRRHAYMYCYTRRERNFMHSLIFSFASNNPIHITAGKYFVVNKTLLLVITGSIFTYYIILLQFNAADFDLKARCLDSVCKDQAAYQDNYDVKDPCGKIFLVNYTAT